MKNRPGRLYFIRCDEQVAVKVGFAVDPATRLPSLQSGNPAKLTLVEQIPVESDAERILHDFMKPHRIAREWYPDDILMDALAGQLCDLWEEKVEAKLKVRVWAGDPGIWLNEAGIYLTAREVARGLRQLVEEFFDMSDEEPGTPPLEIPNHWAKMRKLRA